VYQKTRGQAQYTPHHARVNTQAPGSSGNFVFVFSEAYIYVNATRNPFFSPSFSFASFKGHGKEDASECHDEKKNMLACPWLCPALPCPALPCLIQKKEKRKAVEKQGIISIPCVLPPPLTHHPSTLQNILKGKAHFMFQEIRATQTRMALPAFDKLCNLTPEIISFVATFLCVS